MISFTREKVVTALKFPQAPRGKIQHFSSEASQERQYPMRVINASRCFVTSHHLAISSMQHIRWTVTTNPSIYNTDDVS